MRLAEPLTKWAVEASDPAELPILLRRAFKVALEPPRGPTFISVPTNVMDEEAEVQIAPANYVDTNVRPSAEAAERIARLFIDARSPTLIVGDGVSISGGQAELVQLAELTGARVHSSFAAELPFPSAHPLYQGLLNVISPSMLKGQLADADLVVAIGTPVLTLLFPLDEPPFAENTKVVHIDLNAREILSFFHPGHENRDRIGIDVARWGNEGIGCGCVARRLVEQQSHSLCAPDRRSDLHRHVRRQRLASAVSYVGDVDSSDDGM